MIKAFVRGSAALGVATLALMAMAPAGGAAPASGGKGGSSPAGYDISYPQCGGPFPSSPAFGIVGVNDGIVYSSNPCLGTTGGPSELAWAEAATNHAPAFYANTANPGPAYSSHWPIGQSAPEACTSADPDSIGCSFDYGWNAAKDSFGDAVTAEQQLHGTAAGVATAAAAGAPWWLDVETGNSWETLESAYGQTYTAQNNDTNALLGAVAALHDAGVATVGVYSTSYQWQQITGGHAVTGNQFTANPSWVAGSSSASAAKSLCGTTGFTGGPVKLAQYHQKGFDADVAC